MKRFTIGFIVGVALMYWYLNNGEAVEQFTRGWFAGAASKYRDDKAHSLAHDALGESEQRR
jgi:hypothetical protein